ncbi:MAG: PhzF family phenazine biosynthesis protein [Rhodothermales bacterium]|nr:PhzF family phenazine biosynthesis protein [Rhodothermales bacterium]
MAINITQVDAFTSRPFSGNPAAVCILDDFPDDELMQQIATEMHLSETAFVVRGPSDGKPDESGSRGFRLRWFTPGGEVDLCGHATLASAHILFESDEVALGDRIEFSTLSGSLFVNRTEDGCLCMDFPAEPVNREVDRQLFEDIVRAPIVNCGANRMDVLVELAGERMVRTCNPDLRILEEEQDVRGLIVTARSSDPEFDFVSRFFAPQLDVPEDPVTGSAHCCLAPYWAERFGKNRMQARQVSDRGGELTVELHGSRVRLEGRAVTVMSAVMHV